MNNLNTQTYNREFRHKWVNVPTTLPGFWYTFWIGQKRRKDTNPSGDIFKHSPPVVECALIFGFAAKTTQPLNHGKKKRLTGKWWLSFY